ncbi:unnamed protein product, partial [Cyprideis torosa]
QALYTDASNQFSATKKLIEGLLSPSAASQQTVPSVSRREEELNTVLKVAKTNSVVAKLLAGGYKKGVPPSFDFDAPSCGSRTGEVTAIHIPPWRSLTGIAKLKRRLESKRKAPGNMEDVVKGRSLILDDTVWKSSGAGDVPEETGSSSPTQDVQPRQHCGARRHTKTNTKQKQHSCSSCDARFTYMSELKRHEQIHSGEKPFSCLICDARFAMKGNLRKHERTHTGEKPFSCSHCDARFAERSSLKRHERCHSGDKPFSCPICDARFAMKGNLTDHERTHTGERPFCCSHCDARFTKSSHLKRHEQTHSGDKPFSCPICDARFAERSSLKSHERCHSGDKPFSCLICDA